MSNITRAYQCDEQGVLVGETLVQEDPLEPGVFLLPPGCVLIAPPAFDARTQVAILIDEGWAVHDLPPQPEASPRPASASLAAEDLIPPERSAAVSAAVPTPSNMPKAGEHEIAVIVDGQWAVVSDWRDTVYWLADGSVHRITALGQTPPDDALSSPPSLPLPAGPTDPTDEQN